MVNDEHQKAIDNYTKAIELNPKDAAAYYNRGRAYYNLGQYQKAIDDYTKAIELDPNCMEAYYSRGCAYDSLEEYRKAIEDYNKVIELDPQSSEGYFKRGYAYYYLGEHSQALEDFYKAAELDPDYASDSYYPYPRGTMFFENREQNPNQKTAEDKIYAKEDSASELEEKKFERLAYEIIILVFLLIFGLPAVVRKYCKYREKLPEVIRKKEARMEEEAKKDILNKNKAIEEFRVGKKEKYKEKYKEVLARHGIEDFGYEGDTLYIYVRDSIWKNIRVRDKEPTVAILKLKWSKVIHGRNHRVYTVDFQTRKIIERFE